ncbi:MAG: MG2 domain-containing protein [Candidatus Eremiobacteraeota bacterium]|nr:MG2 domain-containing protein [Candidatus Eremiobacteraeota bacterium]
MKNRIWITGGLLVIVLMAALIISSCGRTGGGIATSGSVPSQFLETRIIGQNTLLCGTPASLRVIVFDARGMTPVKDARVEAVLAGSELGQRHRLFSDKTNDLGTIAMTYTVPADARGAMELTVTVKAGEGERSEKLPVTVSDKEPKISLSTDKPLYQPGQVIHIKALALELPTLEPLAKKKMILEVLDPKGNKVVKLDQETSPYGIVGLDFSLAREINLGEYVIRASAEGGAPVEKKVMVKKYVLPKFKAELVAKKKFYTPGETLDGHVSARYFFGKPVAEAEVLINILASDDRLRKVAVLKGKTDKDGVYKFSFKVPRDFNGIAFHANKAFLAFEANVRDTAEHKEAVYHQYPVAKYPISVQVMPEGGRMIPGLENILYLVASYPDGSPSECKVQVKLPEGNTREVVTDAGGYGTLTVTPKKNESVLLRLQARDRQGNESEKTVSFSAGDKEETVLLRTDKTLYNAGDPVKVKVLSSRKEGAVYLDFLRNGHTLYTQSVFTRDGQGDGTLEVPAEVSGMVALNAYFVSPYTGVVQDSRSLYFAPSDLNVAVKLDKETYQPGGEAKLEFKVTDKKGNPVPSALGVDLVDESVFAMFERRPGMETIYFLVPADIMKAPYVLGGLTMRDFILNAAEPQSETCSKVVLAQAPQLPQYQVVLDSFAQKQQKILADLEKIEGACEKFYGAKQKYPSQPSELVAANMLAAADTKDPWGRDYLIKAPEKPGGPQAASPAGGGPVVINVGGGPAMIHPGRPFPGKFIDREEVGGPPRDGLIARPAAPPQAYGPPGWSGTLPNIVCVGADGKEGTPDDLDLKALFLARGPQLPQVVAMPGKPMMEEREMMAGGAAPQGAMMKMQANRADMAMPSAAPPPEAKQASLESAQEPVRVREYFPETLMSVPELITDDKGIALLTVPLADSITTWRLSALANSLKGKLGSTTGGIKVFQDFFVDLDLPVKLTQGDEVSIPVRIFNYLPKSQQIAVTLEKGDWFEVLDKELTQKRTVEKEDVVATRFTIRVKEVGIHKLNITARGSELSDAISREIEVEPDGKKYLLYKGDLIKSPGSSTSIEIPGSAIANGSDIQLVVYPRPVSQIIEGMDTIFRMPGGCFEQTSSITYPNVLVLDYLKKSGQSTPQVEKKALEYINQGYQRLLGYEIQGGGFQVWGAPPATKVLTAYGIMEFSDMAKVAQVDKGAIDRAKRWLLSQKQPDGSWTPDQSFAHAEQWGTIQSNNMPTTAYLTWALAEAGCKGEIADSISYLKKQAGQVSNPYILALMANAFIAYNINDGDGAKLLDRLNGMKTEEKEGVYWKTDSLYSQGLPASVETTALVVYAMQKTKKYPETIGKGLSYLVKSKDQNGLWYSTQATIFAMRALLLSQVSAPPEPAELTADIIVNGEKADSFTINDKNLELFQQFDLKKYVKNGRNDVKIEVKGKGECAYRVAGTYYLPWTAAEKARNKELDIQVAYDRTEVKTQDSIACKVKVKNLRNSYAPMVMVEVGTPPGFDVMTEDIERMVAAKKVQKFEMASDRVVLYLNGVEKGKSFDGSFRLTARYPLKVKTPTSLTYLYYNPEVNARCAPVTIRVN